MNTGHGEAGASISRTRRPRCTVGAMPLRRLVLIAVLALSLNTTGCVTAGGPAGPPAGPTATAPPTARLDPAGSTASAAPTRWPSPVQDPGRHVLATTGPDRAKKKPAGGSSTRRGRAAQQAQQPVEQRPRGARPRPAAKPAQKRPRRIVVPRRKPLQGAPAMRQLCRQSRGV
ncbi:hypothetical protein ABZX29_34775, partial [Streptomyces zhihengii]